MMKTRRLPIHRLPIPSWRLLGVCALCLASLTLLVPGARAADNKDLDESLARLCRQLEEKRVEHHIPGMSLCIVKDDKVLLTRAGSGGGGATTTARLGAGTSAPETTGSQVGPGSSPSETLQRYFEVLARRDTNPALELYTPESRWMLADWLVTRAQMDNLLLYQ